MNIIKSTTTKTIFTVVLLLFPFVSLYACPSDQYEGAFGWCYPKIGGTPGQLTEGIKKGDINQVAKAIGDIAITYSCPGCAIVGQTILQKRDRELVSTIVGRGLILTTVGAPPSLITLDALATTATAIALEKQPNTSINIPKPQGRTTKTYSSTTIAACAVITSSDNKVIAAWLSEPTFVDVSTGKPSTYPNIDLQENDIIHVTANNCPQESLNTGGITVNNVSFKYTVSSTVPGPSEQMKYFLIGKKIN